MAWGNLQLFFRGLSTEVGWWYYGLPVGHVWQYRRDEVHPEEAQQCLLLGSWPTRWMWGGVGCGVCGGVCVCVWGGGGGGGGVGGGWGGEIPVACWQQALCTIVPMPLACGRLSFGHGHGLPVPWWPFSWSGLSWVRGHVIPYDRQGQIGEWQKTQILKFNSPTPYTLSLQCPSNRKFSQLSYEPGCSRELWCRKCATWLWNKYVLIFSKTLFYTHIQRHTAAAGTKSYKTM